MRLQGTAHYMRKQGAPKEASSANCRHKCYLGERRLPIKHIAWEKPEFEEKQFHSKISNMYTFTIQKTKLFHSGVFSQSFTKNFSVPRVEVSMITKENLLEMLHMNVGM